MSNKQSGFSIVEGVIAVVVVGVLGVIGWTVYNNYNQPNKENIAAATVTTQGSTILMTISILMTKCLNS